MMYVIIVYSHIYQKHHTLHRLIRIIKNMGFLWHLITPDFLSELHHRFGCKILLSDFINYPCGHIFKTGRDG